MLLETSEGRRRLYREGDPSHPNRAGAKTRPDPGDLPPEYASLLEWYAAWSRESRIRQAENDPLLAARGSGRHLWSPEAIDDYVRELREGWE
ncbi:MAG TPA: hypothetical protein VJP87_02790 [Candidatus Acidoferrales bacterium]|nr:hypothetical protein [Candidatus Acidoferrales bacterium]